MTRPIIKLSPRGSDLHADVDNAVGVLGADEDVYRRDTELVHVVRVDEGEDDYLASGSPMVRTIPDSVIRERLTRGAQWMKYDAREKDWVGTAPATSIVSAVSGRGDWPAIRSLVGVLEAPSLRPDGTIIDEPGYDASTGYLYIPNAEFPQVDPRPTRDDAAKALEELREVFVDFPFREPDERDAVIAMALTMFARPAIRGAVPGLVVDSPTPGSGKSLVCDAVSVIALGREASRMSYPPDLVELEKVLGAYALRGVPVVVFDNVTSTFGGGPLDKVLTAQDRVELRVLGKSELPSVRWRAVVLASGNNVVLGTDTARRVLVARIEPDVERPEERTGFRHPKLVQWVASRRPLLATAALTILRAYIAAGRPKMGTRSWGSFEGWSELVPPAIVFAGGADVMACRASQNTADVDPVVGAIRMLVSRWAAFERAYGPKQQDMGGEPPQGLLGSEIRRALWPAPETPDGWDDVRDALDHLCNGRPGKGPSARQLGKGLKRIEGRTVGGRRIRGLLDPVANSKRWTVSESRSEVAP